MKETSWRTLMLMTAVFILVVIFEGTVRPYRPPTPLIGPAMACPPADANKLPDRRPPSAEAGVGDPGSALRPSVTTAPVARPVWLNNRLLEPSEASRFTSPEPEDRNQTEQSSTPVADDPNGSSLPLVE